MQQAPRAERYDSLDILRGVAVLGILAINIQTFAQPFSVFQNPTLLPDVFAREGWVWRFVSVFFQFKFITIFSALFGAGIILMVGEEKPSPRFGLHYRRMLWLAIFGLLHAFVLWFGDILFPYAFAGLIVVLARRWKPATLVIVGLVIIALNFMMFMGQHFYLEGASPEEAAKFLSKMWTPPPEELAKTVAIYQLPLAERIVAGAGDAAMFLMIQTLALGPRTIGVMMIGMALYKSGFFTLGWSGARYLVTGVIAAAIGVAATHWGVGQFYVHNFDGLSLTPAQGAIFWGSLPQAFGYAALIMWAASLGGLKLLLAPFAAAGRMALTNYLACSIICALIFFGPPGAGLIGEYGFVKQAWVTLAIWAAILVWSPIWLSLFRFGPFEWLWRSLTYWRLQPLFKGRAAPVGGAL